VFDRIGGGVDERHGITSDRDHRDGLVVGGKAHAMNQDLPFVERTEISRLRITEANDANQLVVDRIGDGDRVGELLGGIDAVMVADRNIRIRGGTGSLAGDGGRNGCDGGASKKRQREKRTRH
jgi:hypothetical protein